MSTDPTQPMSQPQRREAPQAPESPGTPGAPGPGQPAQPGFSPAQPSFSPAQPRPPQAQPGQSGQPGSWERQGGWQQETQHSPQPGWPPEADEGNGAPTRQWRPPGQGGYPGAPGAPGAPGGRVGPPPRRRRRRRWTMSIFALIVAAILLVIADRVALAIAENDMANQFVSNGLPVKPSVSIEGFPFLTQLAERDLHKVDISASNIPAGPVTITSATATLTGMHFNSSFNSATVDHMTVNLFVSFSALAAAGGLANGTGITVTPAGPDLLKITAGVGGVLSDTEEAKVTQSGPQQISVQVLNNGGVLGGLLSSFGSFTFNLPKGVPASLRITGITLNDQGLTVSAAATNANLSETSS